MPVDTDHMRHEGSKVSASTADFGQQTDSDLERFQEKWAPLFRFKNATELKTYRAFCDSE